MQQQGLSERAAVYKTSRQLLIKNRRDLQGAFRLVLETSRRMNYIDRIITERLHPTALDSLSLGVQNLLRVVLCSRLLSLQGGLGPEQIVKAGRDILGWEETWGVEKQLGLLLAAHLSFDEPHKEEERLGLQTAHPAWFVRRCVRWFGRDFALKLLNGNLKQIPNYVRVNPLRGESKGILEKLEKSHVKLEPIQGLEGIFRPNPHAGSLTGTASFLAGEIAVHDLSTYAAVACLDIKPELKVADVCAAPGSKTGTIASMMINHGLIVSLDKSPRRMKLWKKEIKRLGVANAHAVLANCSGDLPLNEKFDRVLVDPPCSNSGVFAKSPYLKWGLKEKQIDSFSSLQFTILSAMSEFVKAGGVLVYCTCSVLPEENELVTERFLSISPDFHLENTDLKIGLPGLRGLAPCRRLFTHMHDCNGFFIAKLRRRDG